MKIRKGLFRNQVAAALYHLSYSCTLCNRCVMIKEYGSLISRRPVILQ